MIANVNEQVWVDYDLDIAVFLDTIAYWIKKNAANKQEHNFHEGRYWTYNSQEAFQKMFPGWQRETIRRIIRNCLKHQLLIVGNFNKKCYDRTGWYSLTDKAVQYYPSLREIMGKPANNPSGDSCVEINQALVETNPAIPTLLPTSSNNTITTSESADSAIAANPVKKIKSLELMQQMIEVYRETFPDNPQPHSRAISTSLQKALQTFIKRWPEVDPGGRSLDLETFRKYMMLLRTTAPRFSLGEYITKDGHKKKNGMETFCRWNTLVKFLEDQYS